MADYIEENRQVVKQSEEESKESGVSMETENVIFNAGISEFQVGLARAINETYSYKYNSLFYALVPTYLRDYMWKYIRPACQWLDGYVPALHADGRSGIVSTRIGTKLITGLTKQIVGEKLIFKPNDKNDAECIDTLRFVTKWSDEENIIKAIYGGIGFSLGIGTSLIKINKTIDDKLWWEPVRFDRCFYATDFKDDVVDCKVVIRNYTDTREGKSNQQFFLVEHRYYKIWEKPDIVKKLDGTYETIHKKGEKQAMVKYSVHRVSGTMFGENMPSQISNVGVSWGELPDFIKKAIKKDYAVMRLDEEQPLGLMNLGVFVLQNGNLDLSVPTGTGFGESMLVGIQDDLITYEVASSYLIRDMYLGKGTVYVPKSLNITDTMGFGGIGASVLQGVGNDKIELLKGVNPENQQIIVQQFNIRVAEWQTAKENALKGIAVKWGMSPKILASFLASGTAQMTATQIDSEDDLSKAFIYHTRSYFKNALNKALETTLNFYGYKTNIDIDFASPSLINKDRLLERVKNQLEIGVIDIEEAIRILNPDLDEEAIQSKVEKAKAQQQEMMMQQLTEMNDDGSFGQNPDEVQMEKELNGNGPIQ